MKLFTLAFLALGQTAHAAPTPARAEFAAPEAPAAVTGRLDVLPAALDPDDLIGQQSTETKPLTVAKLSRRDALVKVMEHYGDMTYVPYVWAGGKIGTKSSCLECRACVDSKPHLKVERRLKSCTACQQCGIDCSHFANRVLTDAGLPYPYIDTRGLTHFSREELRRKYNLVDMGRDTKRALPGDLLLFKHHVVMVLDSFGDGMGDILHVSRSTKRKGTGGIEVVRGQSLGKFRGRLVKILRHGSLDDGETRPAGKQRNLNLPSPDEVSRHQLVV